MVAERALTEGNVATLKLLLIAVQASWIKGLLFSGRFPIDMLHA